MYMNGISIWPDPRGIIAHQRAHTYPPRVSDRNEVHEAPTTSVVSSNDWSHLSAIYHLKQLLEAYRDHRRTAFSARRPRAIGLGFTPGLRSSNFEGPPPETSSELTANFPSPAESMTFTSSRPVRPISLQNSRVQRLLQPRHVTYSQTASAPAPVPVRVIPNFAAEVTRRANQNANGHQLTHPLRGTTLDENGSLRRPTTDEWLSALMREHAAVDHARDIERVRRGRSGFGIRQRLRRAWDIVRGRQV